MSLDNEIDMKNILSQDMKNNEKIPNGIGFTIEEIQALISKENKTFLPEDDPTMMIVTILNAFLGENKKLQDNYLQALRTLFSELSKGVNSEILATSKKVLEDVQDTLKIASITGLMKIHEQQTKQVMTLRQHILYACVFIGASTFFNILTLIWK